VAQLASAGFHDVEDEEVRVEDDPYIAIKPARRKLKLTDLVPDVGYFIAGGVSGITSRTVTAPLDRLKVYLIAQTTNSNEAVQAAKSGAPIKAGRQGMRTLVNACKDLWAAGGIRSLFAGE
jgi:solute carrier family 25 phosphate transporter 23/24/25/41